MTQAPLNHRLLAREHLAEATALAAEGDARAAHHSLLAATSHAIDELAAGHRVDSESRSRAIAILTLRGALPFDPRGLLTRLQERSEREPPESVSEPARELTQCIASVQALVDLAVDVPSGPLPSHGWQRWGAQPEPDDEEFAPLPVRATAWLQAVAETRRRRRRHRLRSVIGTAACVIALGGLGLAWSNAVDGTEYHSAKADIGFYDSGS